MSAVVLEDFYKPFFKKELTDSQSNWLLKIVVIVLGALSLALVFVVEKLGTVLQLTMSLEAVTMGPQLGIFTMGILIPWVDGVGALIGGATGLILMAWWCLTAQLAIAGGLIVHPHKPLSVEGCQYNYNATEPVTVAPELIEDVNPILRVSYMWYTLAGAVVTICVGATVSRINRARGKAHISPAPRLLAPQLRRFCKEPPHPTDEPYIRAYGINKDACQLNSTSLDMKMIDEGVEEVKS
ncbi:sodium:solute symporter family domain-containing protein [Phthorimaea operculella]|nr:sodium:solute symporter family domain-containing protein [Phthorimaea operculella]